MSKTLCASRCSRRSVQGALRAPAEGEGRLARREDLTAAAAATLERGGSRGGAGTVAHGTRAARERRRRRAKVSRRRRAGRAPPARPGRSSRVPRIRTPGGPMVGAPLKRRRADDFFLGLGFPPVNWGSISVYSPPRACPAGAGGPGLRLRKTIDRARRNLKPTPLDPFLLRRNSVGAD